MTEKLSGVPAVKPSTPIERKWISAEAAKEASKRALDRLKDQIVDSLRVKLESPVLQNGEAGDSVSIFKQALSDPTVTNVRLVQALLRKEYPTVAIDGQLGRQTLSAMDKFIAVLAERARKSREIVATDPSEPVLSVTNPNDSAINTLVKPAPASDPKPVPPNSQKSLKLDAKTGVVVRGSMVQGTGVLANEDSFTK